MVLLVLHVFKKELILHNVFLADQAIWCRADNLVVNSGISFAISMLFLQHLSLLLPIWILLISHKSDSLFSKSDKLRKDARSRSTC